MHLLRRLIALAGILCLLLTLSAPVYAEETESPQDLIQQMLCYYHHHQTAGKTDIYRLLARLEALDPEKASLWQDIFEYWFYATDDLPRNVTELPDDLPQDDSLCIVVLGYRLAGSGYMFPELTGRLELALYAAEKYPNALVLCTGGGTAPDAPDITEAGQMSYWLLKNGVEKERIITEPNSLHTIDNAKYSFDIIQSRYPQIRHLVIVTSDYHLPRSTTLFHAKAALTAYETGAEPITIAAILGYDADHEGVAEDPLDQTAHLARLMGFEYVRAEEPPLSRLEDIEVSCEDVLEIGALPEISVTAQYDSGFSRDVCAECSISAFDPECEKTQTITVTYSENGTQISVAAEIRRPPKPTEPPVTEPPATQPTPAPEIPEAPAASHFPWIPIICIVVAILLAVLLKKRR